MYKNNSYFPSTGGSYESTQLYHLYKWWPIVTTITSNPPLVVKWIKKWPRLLHQLWQQQQKKGDNFKLITKFNADSVSWKQSWDLRRALWGIKRNCWKLRFWLFRLQYVSTWQNGAVVVQGWAWPWESRSSICSRIKHRWSGQCITWTSIVLISIGCIGGSCRFPLLSFFCFFEEEINPKICKGLR